MARLWRNFLPKVGGLLAVRETDLKETPMDRVGIIREKFSPFFRNMKLPPRL